MANDVHGNRMEDPMEIPVLVLDENDNSPECDSGDIVFELQEGEGIGNNCATMKILIYTHTLNPAF